MKNNFKIKSGFDSNGLFRVKFSAKPITKRKRLKSGKVITYAQKSV